MKKSALKEVLEGIEDTKRTQSVMYSLDEVLIIMLLAVICGATSYAKVEMFGKSKRKWLGTFLYLEYGIPDACLFCKWMKSVVSELSGVIAIDGKTARKTQDKNKRPLHVVNAFSHECGLVMGQIGIGKFTLYIHRLM